MFRITKEFHLSASHQLTSLPPDHQCARLHGHNYIVEVELSAKELNEHGFVRDYHELAPLKHYIDESFDRRHLNEVLGHEQVTAEYLARHAPASSLDARYEKVFEAGIVISQAVLIAVGTQLSMAWMCFIDTIDFMNLPECRIDDSTGHARINRCLCRKGTRKEKSFHELRRALEIVLGKGVAAGRPFRTLRLLVGTCNERTVCSLSKRLNAQLNLGLTHPYSCTRRFPQRGPIADLSTLHCRGRSAKLPEDEAGRRNSSLTRGGGIRQSPVVSDSFDATLPS